MPLLEHLEKQVLRCFLLFIILGLSITCKEKPSSSKEQAATFFDRVNNIPDDIEINDIIIHNLFKYQILAHRDNAFDSAMIIDKVYHRHPKIWNELYGVLFDSAMFKTPEGLVAWNAQLFQKNCDSIRSRVNALLDAKFDSTLRAGLKGIKKLTGRTPQNIRLSIILAPVEGIGFGGMKNDAFILDLLDPNFEVVNMVEEGIPHELNHFIYEGTRENDPNKSTPLRLTIDEGFACFYTYKYFNGKISKQQAVEQMTEDEWNWYVLHEREIFDKCSPYFFYKGDGDPLRKLGPEMNAPKTLFYWLGFRIVEAYTRKYGPDSWKDIYDMPVKEVLDKSCYTEYIGGLR